MMDLPINNIADQEMSIGTEIPMWYFDEAKGLWVEESVGHVVESALSSTGLAVHATIAHFSTWNWDYEYKNEGCLFVQCISEGQTVPCYVTANMTLTGGSKFSNSTYLAAENTEIINMPSEGTIDWQAYGVENGLIGQTQSSTDASVKIELKLPTTKNNVSCELADGTATACEGLLNNEITFSVGVSGTQVASLANTQNLQWRASTPFMWKNNQWVRYHGTQTSDTSENVVIKLTESETFGENLGLGFDIECRVQYTSKDLTGETCHVTLEIENTNQEWQTLRYQVPFGVRTKINLPEPYTGFDAYNEGPITNMRAYLYMLNGQYCAIWYQVGPMTRYPENSYSYNIYLDPTDGYANVDSNGRCTRKPQ